MEEKLYIQRWVTLRQRVLSIDGAVVCKGAPAAFAPEFFVEIYKFLEINYMRFFKMDNLSKTLFLSAEALLKDSGLTSADGDAQVALALYNSHSSLDTDKQFQATIQSDAFFPSPSLFIYTLPNIALGEVAIRNRFMGENCTFIASNFDTEHCIKHVKTLINSKKYNHVICGWFDFLDDREEADLFLVSHSITNKIFDINNLEKCTRWKS